MSWKQQVLSLANGTGVEYPLLRVYDSITGITGGADNDIRDFFSEDYPNGAVIFTLIPAYRSICYRYCILADAFRRRGYKPIVLVDDDALDAPFERTVNDNEAITAQTRYFRQRIPEKFGIDTVKVSSLIRANKSSTDELVEDIDIERYARGSIRKHLKKYSLDWDSELVAETNEKFTSAGKKLAEAVGELFDRYDTVALISHEPYYIQGGVPLEVAKQFDTPAYSQGWGFRLGHIMFGRAENRSALQQYTDPSLVNSILSNPLSDSEADEIDRILRERESGTNMSIAYSARTDKSVEPSEGETLVSIFTNLLWDASLEPEQAVYGNVYEWLADTLEVLGGLEDTKVVIKTHPAEEKFGTNESVTGWADSRGDLPNNVTVLPPDTEIDTYALLAQMDAAVVYNSTVGLEAACRQVPVVVAGDTHYQDFGLTVDPDSKVEYREVLESISSIECTSEMQTLARRYAHLLFVKKHIEFKFCQQEQGAEQDLKTVTKADTEPGSEPFDTIVSAIGEGRDIFSPGYAHLTKQLVTDNQGPSADR